MQFFLLIGACFAAIAGLMALLITYEEYAHHFPDAGTARKMALESGLVTFIFFLCVSLAVGFVVRASL